MKIFIGRYALKILALDFDKTITDIHTGGYPDSNKSYWNNIDNLNNLIKVLQNFKINGWRIYIVSRGMKNLIEKFIEDWGEEGWADLRPIYNRSLWCRRGKPNRDRG